jgi:dihydropteroate synthase
VIARAFPAIPTAHGDLAFGHRTLVMAILNLTPDSFSGDGLDGDVAAAVDRARLAEAEGADLLDLGAESTRPGSTPIDAAEELHRLLPALHAVRAATSLPISIDTSKAAVAEAALAAGADIVNDVRGFTRNPELAAVTARSGAGAIVMHDVPVPAHEDLVLGILRELERRIDRVVAAGVPFDRIMVDPGFGFGKDWRENLLLLRRLTELATLQRPVLVGLSRKRTIGRVLDLPEAERLEGTLAATVLAIQGGADLVRVHDVRANVRAARMTDAVVRRIPDAPDPAESPR